MIALTAGEVSKPIPECDRSVTFRLVFPGVLDSGVTPINHATMVVSRACRNPSSHFRIVPEAKQLRDQMVTLFTIPQSVFWSRFGMTGSQPSVGKTGLSRCLRSRRLQI
jgi:hypothetical protein